MFQFLDQVSPETIPWVKIGLQMFCKYGPALVEEVGGRGYNVFLDLKLHDISNTVAGAVESLGSLPIKMLTLHGSGGLEMMRRAAQARDEFAPDLRLLAVTVLTSLDAEQLAQTGVPDSPQDQVLRLVKLTQSAGISGIVCSPNEIRAIRDECGDAPFLVTPGIRPAGAALGDQKRALTPKAAVELGTNALVVGRPITAAADPQAAYKAILAEMEGGLDNAYGA